ncbi:MAG: aromatic ring-hydroxylating dioxygenase subunit alpha [Gammaproteobacteria bacterium]|nr:aromatic ring-hydroxylating dioxygenase subunit alpha [Gammaproteobacteria bacterium]
MTTFPEARSFNHNTDAEPESAEAKAPYVDNGEEIFSTDRYTSIAFAEQEWERMWARTWTLAGLVADIPNVGDYFKYDLGPESFIVVRTGDAPHAIKAFYNVCHHRGNRLVIQDFGSVRSFKCFFHSWEWEIDGKLKLIPNSDSFPPALIADEPPLAAVRCELWDGFVFINMDPNAQPLLEFLSPLPEHLAAYRFADMKIVKDLETPWPCNWKIGHDAFIEVQHVHAVHPEILGFINEYEVQWDLYQNGMSRQLLKFAEVSPKLADRTTVNDGLKALMQEVELDPDTYEGSAEGVRVAIQQAKRAWAERRDIDYSMFTDNQLTDDWNYGIFPNVTFNAHPEGLLIQRFRPDPRDPQRMTYDLMVLIHPLDDPDYNVPAYMGVEEGTDLSGLTRPERQVIQYGEEGLGYVINQDASMMGHVQRGVQSRGYKGARYSHQEQQLRHWHKELERYMNGEKEKQ